MLGYRHVFHAGNVADVVKHAALALTVEALKRKDKPFFYLETHAATGRYDLGSDAAQKTGEYRDGIGRLWEWDAPPEQLAPYLGVVRALNTNGRLRFYPGSPRIVRELMRPDDRMALCELAKNDHAALEAEFAHDRRVATHLMDGYQALKAFLPPSERRGLVFIDPAYEGRDEYARVLNGLAAGLRRWATGCYAVWYPILQRSMADRFLKSVMERGWRRLLVAELTVLPDDRRDRLNGSGMLFINPPWQLDTQLEAVLPALWSRLSPAGEGYTRVEWLAGE
jgi:23S rRNA (adenine2030-N6)-methyltransferase